MTTVIPLTVETIAQASVFDNSHLAEYAKLLREKYLVNRRVLLIQTLQLQLDAFNRDVARNRGYYVYPPTGLQCLAKALAGRNVEVEILDLNYQFLKRIIEDDSFRPEDWLAIVDEHLKRFKPSIVGVTSIGVSTDLFKPTHPLTGVLQHVRRKDKYIVLAGGPVATNVYDEYIKHDVCHFVSEGEGENKINFLFDHLLGEDARHAATSGVYFKYNNQIEQTKGDFDKVVPQGNLINEYRLVPIEDYNNVGSLNPFSRMAGLETHFTGIQLNRGCRANCKFCGVPTFMGRGVRQVPYQDLYEELVYLIEERGVKHFELLDDDFLGPANLRDGVTELLKKMTYLHERYGTTWSAGNGLIAASVTEELSTLIHSSGCIGFRIGIESGNEKMLKRMRKPASKSSLRNFATMMNRYPDIFIGGNYIIGLFGEENFAEMLDSYEFSCELDIDWASFSVYQFTSTATTKKEQLKHDGKAATEFVPTKDDSSRELKQASDIKEGIEIFNIPRESIPSREQIKEIWFVFNLLSNYINNKNLRLGGNPVKLISWLKAIQLTYPRNPYMPLFTGLGQVLIGEKKSAQGELQKARMNIHSSDYWKKRFRQFHLNEILDNFPQSQQDVYGLLDAVERKNFASVSYENKRRLNV